MVARPEGRVPAGSIVRVEDRVGHPVGQAFYNPKSEIALRLLTRGEGGPVNDRWLRRAIQNAVSLRRDALGLERMTDAYRVVFSEGDGLSGLIVDRYRDVLSLQVGSLGIHRVFATLRDELERIYRPRAMHISADVRIAKKEGFQVPDGVGDLARTVIHENDIAFEVDPARGHKTGFFLDQRDSRRRIRDLAKGRRVLDLCCYTGGFSLNAARGGAAEVVGVDLDEEAIAQAVRNAKRNRLTKTVEFVHADQFTYLREYKGEPFDLIIVDPAKQAMREAEVDKALGYYTDLNALVFEKAARGALVLTCSCTGMVYPNAFQGALAQAGERARRTVTFLETTGAPGDHPVPSDFPQARYLKCVLCRVG
jgi:23S rRNA (cytosine1962-C5)-methyltransferase